MFTQYTDMFKFKKNEVLNYVGIALLAMVHAVCYNLFIIENKFAPAGLNGIAVMIQYALNDYSLLGYMSLLINVPLCVFSFFTTDRQFAMKTGFFVVVYSVAYLALQAVDTSGIRYNAAGNDTIYPIIIAGTIGGFVYAGCFRLNSSTGGTDIVSKYISKKKPELNFFWVTFVLNAAVAVASLFVYAEKGADGKYDYSWKPVCQCLLYCFLSSFISNLLIKGGKSAYKFLIITSHAEEIDYEIVHTLKHSATKIVGTGVYSNLEKDVIVCVINKHQIMDFQNILKKYDDTFAFVETVNETIGNFKIIK